MQPKFTAQSFYGFLRDRQLMGSRCATCGALYLPPRPMCRACHGDQMVWEELTGRGELIAFTVVHIAPTAMLEVGYGRDNPYCSGIVRLEEGVAVSAQILGVDASRPQDIAIGLPVEVAFVAAAGDADGGVRLTFRPVDGRQNAPN